MSLIIRVATAADSPVIVDYNQRLAHETEDKQLTDNIISTGVSALLADSTLGIYYLACDEQRIAGQLMITKEWSDWRNGSFWWIQSVYVDAKYRRKGIFGALYTHVRQLAAEDPSVCGIRLYVEHNNRRAQQTYRQQGMAMTHYHIMQEEF